MKIGFLVPAHFAFDGPGNGVRVQAEHQAHALTSLGHEVVLFDPWQNYDLKTFDVIHYFQGGLYMLRIERRAFPNQVARVWAPIIDTNQSDSRYRWAARLGHMHPKIYTIPGTFQDQARGSDAVVVRSSHERERVISGLGADPASVKLVLNGVNPPTPVDPNRAQELTGFNEPFVLHISRYTDARKNALAIIRAVGPTGLKVVIAGTALPGTMLDAIKREASRYPSVKLLGYLSESDRNALYAACRVFCLPSEHEGTGLVALEAGSYGAAVVITRNGGPIDYFGEHAEYVDPGDVPGLAQAVQRAFARPPSDALRDRILKNLTWADSARALVQAYESALAARRR